MVDWDKELETDTGREAKILDRCYVVNGLPYKLVKVLASKEGGTDILLRCSDDGSCYTSLRDNKAPFKLVNKRIKREGWLNIYKNRLDHSQSTGTIFDTKKAARAEALAGYIATVKIEWEEV